MKLPISSGFSLVELLVVITIMGVLMGVGLLAYSRVQDDQNLKKASQEIQTALAQAQQSAFLGKKPTGCNQLISYTFYFTVDTADYGIKANCTNASYAIKNLKLSKDTLFSASSQTEIEFAALTRELVNSTEPIIFSINNPAGIKTFNITQLGDIR